MGSIEVTEVVMSQKGAADGLRLRRRRLPSPAADEVIVRVKAAGVSFAEVQMLRGRYFNQPAFPFVPGYDLVGEVVTIGSGISHLSVGQQVAALTETGSWATHVVLPAEKLVPVPDGLDPVEVVSLVTNGVTAYQMLHRIAQIHAGDTVVVHGASGGVGTVLTQLAREADVNVIGTASASKHDLVRELGAVPIDYRIDNLPVRVREIAPDGVDAVFDHVGGPGLVDSWRMLGPGGRLVSYGVASALDDDGHRLRPFVPILARLILWNASELLKGGKQRATFYYVQRWPSRFSEDLTQVLTLLGEERIDGQVACRFPLEKAADALELLDSGRVRGKVVLVPSEY
ncbi:NADPH:quinone reductase [Salinigranum rubrum]|uniref:NADPH:quinone reductase n=1 Tax=Salinigranum rubrum TaxID=755307 RepID=A0A2I8VNZ0_9EURY|nr:medium chain dehydrogenase/reductase family protein [Salinigranum rubrum]AUV82829.1 NADPH:quinone reductase [Salinigranum rubrum]